MSKSLSDRLEEMERQFEQIEQKIVDPQVMSQGQLYSSLLKERGRLVKIIGPYRAWKQARLRLKETEGILADEAPTRTCGRSRARKAPSSATTWRASARPSSAPPWPKPPDRTAM